MEISCESAAYDVQSMPTMLNNVVLFYRHLIKINENKHCMSWNQTRTFFQPEWIYKFFEMK